MPTLSIATLLLAALGTGNAASPLSGVWTLDTVRSRFGPLAAPGKLVLCLERTGSHLDAWWVTIGPDAKEVAHRDYTLDGNEARRSTTVTILFPVESTDGKRTMELWRVSAGRLVIQRSVTDGRRTVRQKLVFEPSTPLPETGTQESR